MRHLPRLALLVLALHGSGCSFLSVYGPARSQKASIAVSCTDERYAPALDVAASGGALLNSAFLDLSAGERFGLVAGALAYGGSAIYGYLTTIECQKAKDALHRYHTKLLLRQIDLLNETATQEAEGEEPPAPPLLAPPPALPMEDPSRGPPPAYVPAPTP